jgi:hypothetical protein
MKEPLGIIFRHAVVVSCLISADVVLTLTLKLAVKYEVLPVFVRDILAITLGLFLVFTIVIFAVMAAFFASPACCKCHSRSDTEV